MNNNICKQCGKALKRTQKKYCSVDCLNDSKRFLTNIDCAYCGKSFFPKHKNKKYCSPKCGNLSRRKYSDEYLIQTIKDIAIDGYANSSDLPKKLDVIIKRRFGGWLEACLLANVKPDSTRIKICEICGEKLKLNRGRRTKYCSEECSYEANNNRWIDNTHRRKRIMENTTNEIIDRNYIFKRDKWICHICGERVIGELKHPHPYSPSIDHVIPLSVGGSHTEDNIKLAHLRCNISKGNGRR